MKKIVSSFKDNGIIPVICLKNQQELETLMAALSRTAIRCIEITLRDPFSPLAISYIKANYPEFTVGAGTVVSEETFATACDSGADFCVSPGLDENMIKLAKEKGIPFLPGCATPSEILKATSLGLDTVKFFPAECSGGATALQLYKGAFAGVSFVPTGGITTDNYLNYLNCSNVLACGGSFMIPKEMLASGDCDGIYNLVAELLTAVKGVEK